MTAPTKKERWIQAGVDAESASFERDDFAAVAKYLATPEDHPDGEDFSEHDQKAMLVAIRAMGYHKVEGGSMM